MNRATRTTSSTIAPGDFITALALAACATQRIFDRAYEDDLRRLDVVARSLAGANPSGPADAASPPSPAAHALLTALAPSRLVLSEVTISSEVRCTQTRRTGFSVEVTPLNLAYERRFGSMRSGASRITLTVVQTPSPPPPGPPS